jgi:hypothetical protein
MMEKASTEAQIRLLRELLQTDFPHMKIQHFVDAYQAAFRKVCECDSNSADKKSWHNAMLSIHFMAMIRFDTNEWYDALGQAPKYSNIKSNQEA